MFVVLATTKAATEQEKIKPEFSLSNKYFTDSESVFKFSSVFAFDPFTPFPELLSTSPRPITSTRSTKPTKDHKTSTTKENVRTTTTEATNTLTPSVRILRIPSKKKISNNSNEKFPVDLASNRGFNFTAAGVSRQEVVDREGTVQGVYSYTDTKGQQ